MFFAEHPTYSQSKIGSKGMDCHASSSIEGLNLSSIDNFVEEYPITWRTPAINSYEGPTRPMKPPKAIKTDATQ